MEKKPKNKAKTTWLQINIEKKFIKNKKDTKEIKHMRMCVHTHTHNTKNGFVLENKQEFKNKKP